METTDEDRLMQLQLLRLKAMGMVDEIDVLIAALVLPAAAPLVLS